jgi:hypothetical protein
MGDISKRVANTLSCKKYTKKSGIQEWRLGW